MTPTRFTFRRVRARLCLERDESFFVRPADCPPDSVSGRPLAEFAYTRLAADVNNKKFSGLSRRGLDCHSALAVAVSHRDSLYMPFEGSTRYDNKERGGAE